MVWKTLADALETAIAKGFDVDGEAGVAAPAVSRENGKRTPTNAGAKFTEQRHVEGDEGDTASTGQEIPAPSTMDRCSPAHSKGARPKLGAGRHMFMVIEGGRTTGGGETVVRPMLKPYRVDGRAILRLVSGGHASTSRLS